MKRNRRILRGQAAQINNSPYTGLLCRNREIMRSPPVALCKALRTTAHGMNQVVRNLDSLQCLGQTAGMEDVGLDNADAARTGAESRRISHHARNFVSALHQFWEQVATDISGRARDEDFHDRPGFNRQISKLSRLAKQTHMAYGIMSQNAISENVRNTMAVATIVASKASMSMNASPGWWRPKNRPDQARLNPNWMKKRTKAVLGAFHPAFRHTSQALVAILK